jgi:hypothetical protein
MDIQFAYVQKKTTNEKFIIIYKDDKSPINIYKMCYESIYNKTYNEDLNIYDLIYIKIGLKINYNKDIWIKLVKENMKTLNLIHLIDDMHLMIIYNSNYILFEYDSNKEILNNILIDTFFESYIY